MCIRLPATAAHDPHVWSGRALQEIFVELAVSGLASMYPVSDWSCFAPDHHGYQRACGLIIGQTSMGQLGHQCSHAPGRPILHLYLSSRRPRRVRVVKLGTSLRIPHFTFPYSTIKQIGRWRSSPPRSPDHEPVLTKRCGPACWPARSRARSL
jgi:hypothetical protein